MAKKIKINCKLQLRKLVSGPGVYGIVFMGEINEARKAWLCDLSQAFLVDKHSLHKV
jgi:hypothetical protein